MVDPNSRGPTCGPKWCPNSVGMGPKWWTQIPADPNVDPNQWTKIFCDRVRVLSQRFGSTGIWVHRIWVHTFWALPEFGATASFGPRGARRMSATRCQCFGSPDLSPALVLGLLGLVAHTGLGPPGLCVWPRHSRRGGNATGRAASRSMRIFRIGYNS